MKSVKKNLIVFFVFIFFTNISHTQTTDKNPYNYADGLHSWNCEFGLKMIEISKMFGLSKKVTRCYNTNVNTLKQIDSDIVSEIDTVSGWVASSVIVIESANLAYVVSIGINNEYTVDTKIYVLFSSISDGIPHELIKGFYDFNSMKSTNNTRSDYTVIVIETMTIQIFIRENFYLDAFNLITGANRTLYSLDKYEFGKSSGASNSSGNTKTQTSTTKTQNETDYVYICDSRSSYAYHSSYNCSGLQKCTNGILKVSLSDAINVYNRNPCKFCYR